MVVLDLNTVDPDDLEHLAWLIREQRAEASVRRMDRLEAMWDKPTIGYYRRQRD